MHIERVRPTTFRVTLHAYELASLVAAARAVLTKSEGELTKAARLQLEQVLADYDAACARVTPP